MADKNVLIIGSGGREHALAWKIAQSSQVKHVFVAPGNAGTANEIKVSNVTIDVLDQQRQIEFACENHIDLTIIGPEAPLVNGVVDAFEAAGLACFGPHQQAAQLEASKAFSKDFMQRHGIPTAHYANFTNAADAKDYVRKHGTPIVIKADGLAAGKGVVIAHTEGEAISTIDDMLVKQCFGDAGGQIVIEEFLTGEEASFIVITDGKTALPFATSQDHKARDDGDLGPNTGGMGAYSPAPVVNQALYDQIMTRVIQPTITGMEKDGCHYQGFLYAGVMISPQGEAKVLEFNCRFGDPETQAIMLRLQSDLYALCDATLQGQLASQTLQWDERPALGIVLAAGGYPGTYAKGDIIDGLDTFNEPDVKVFHAGTKVQGQHIITNGGRVLCVTALDKDIQTAQQKAYANVEKIHWDHMYYRHDIGYRAIER